MRPRRTSLCWRPRHRACSMPRRRAASFTGAPTAPGAGRRSMARLAWAGAVAGALLAVAGGSEGAAAQIDTEKRVYETQCASCHGKRAQGAPDWREPDANGEMPAPPHDRVGHTWKHADGMLYRIVRDGWRDPFNKTQ